jgi:AraC-like DNA-binding protein
MGELASREMTTVTRENGSRRPWRTHGGVPRAPALGPPVLVTVGDDRRVPVPRCNNEGQVVFEGDGLRVGLFRSMPGQENFRFSGVPGEHIVVFQRGAVRIRRLGGAPYLADPMAAHFLDPDQIYFRDGIEGESDWALWIGVDAALVDRLLGREEWGESARWQLQIAPVSARTYLLHCELGAAIEEACTEHAELQAASWLLLRRATAEALRFAAWRGDTSLERCVLGESARELLGSQSASGRSVAEIASELGCSPSHLGRLFRRHVDASPHQYRLQVRLRKALVALIEGERNLADLGLRCGFANHSHFTTAFRAAFGVTPSTFRRSARERLRDVLASLPEADADARSGGSRRAGS